jgi:hypothetical protein
MLCHNFIRRKSDTIMFILVRKNHIFNVTYLLSCHRIFQFRSISSHTGNNFDFSVAKNGFKPFLFLGKTGAKHRSNRLCWHRQIEECEKNYKQSELKVQ